MNIEFLSHITALVGVILLSGFTIYKYMKQNRDYKF